MSTALETSPSDMATTSAVAAEVGVCRKTVYNWYKAGKISGEDVTPRLVLVSVSDARREAAKTRSKRTPMPSTSP